MKFFNSFFLILLISTHMQAQTSLHEMTFTTIDDQKKSFKDFAGKKILIFNAASKCGYTSQYKELQELYNKYSGNLVVIGFPANNFGGQEPGSNDEIATFCEKNYGVTFLMAEKVSVKGDDIDPLFSWLTQQENESFTGAIKWNFEKFLIDEKGVLTHRFRSAVSPMETELTKHI